MCNTNRSLVNLLRALRLLVPISLLLGGAQLSGCNTTAGVGKDIEATGDAIEDAAEDAKD